MDKVVELKELLKKCGSIIGGEEIFGPEEGIFRDPDPATGEILSCLYSATTEIVDQAVACAQEAYPEWKKTGRRQRAGILRAMADKMEENIEKLAIIESLDSGRTLGESTVHVQGAIDCYRYFAAAIEAHEETLVCHDSGSFSAIVHEPLGVVGIIVPWNAPTMGVSWKIAPAIATGNTIVIKPSASGSLAIVEAARLWKDIIPKGVLNVIVGSGSAIGNYFSGHPALRKLTFTGSCSIGQGIGKTAGERIIPCTLELGGKSASVIFEDANLDRALQKTLIGILSSTGEICIANSRILIQDTIYDKFSAMLKEKFDGAVVGSPFDPATQVGPVIDEGQLNKVLKYIEAGKESGATLLSGGYRVTGNGREKGFFVAPTLFGDVDNNSVIAQEEIFGPVLCLIKFSTEEEAAALANGTSYGLGAAVWTRDINRAIRFSRALEAGTVWVNDYLDNAPGSPFGGFKNSGVGRELHKITMDYYTQVKCVCVADTDDVPTVW